MTVVITIALVIAYWWLTPARPHPLAMPGSPFLQSTAALGSLLLLGSFVMALLKRFGFPARQAYVAHVWLAIAGFALIAIHSAGHLITPPALLIALLVALLILGIWARLVGGTHMANTFGSKRGGFIDAGDETRERLQQLIETKKVLLETIDSDSNEATFSILPRHWLKSPRTALAYQRANHEEKRLIGTRQSVVHSQAYWRLVHQCLALLFIIGLIVHVVLVLFFPEYVADGEDIYWWHLRNTDNNS